MNPDLTNLQTVLTWLAGVGGPFVVGQVVSLLAENWPKWHTLPRLVKFYVPIAFSVILAVGSTWLLQQKEFLAAVSPWFSVVMIALISAIGYLGTQKGLMDAKRSEYASGSKEIARKMLERSNSKERLT